MDNNNEQHSLSKFIGLRSATMAVIASMIGAGIFTTTGFQAADLGHPGYIFLLWIVGGILAFCGALCFAELGAAIPEPGAEYNYIRRSFGAALGFMSFFVALFAGFSAPIAGALKALVNYLSFFIPAISEDHLILGVVHANDIFACAFVWILVFIHTKGVRSGMGFNDLVTILKIAGIVLILVGTVVVGKGSISNLAHVSETYYALGAMDKMSAFATSLIFVTFCYLGWNGAAYLAAEMTEPQRDLPRSLMLGTGIVTLLYLGLNAMYLYGVGVDGLAGELEVGLVSSRALFGGTGVTLVTLVLCISILASSSAMTLLGPRIYYAFGKDFPALKTLHTTGARSHSPNAALILQGIVTTGIILSGTVDQIIQYAGFTLTLFSSIAVSCVIVLRIREPELERPFKVWLYPFTPLLYIGVSVWTMIWSFRGRPIESTLGLFTVLIGGALFGLITKLSNRK